MTVISGSKKLHNIINQFIDLYIQYNGCTATSDMNLWIQFHASNISRKKKRETGVEINIEETSREINDYDLTNNITMV